MKDGGPAFPRDSRVGAEFSNDGMSLRDWFAGMAVQGMQHTYKFDWVRGKLDESHPLWQSENSAKYAYELADAMLKEREK